MSQVCLLSSEDFDVSKCVHHRCTARSSNLDAMPSPPRSQAWADLMVENLEKKELWDDCGINLDVVVSKSMSF